MFLWLCFCGGVGVFVWWCGSVFVVVLVVSSVVVWLWFCGWLVVLLVRFCGGVVVSLWWCGCVFVFLWWCVVFGGGLCFDVVVVVFLCGGRAVF